MWSVEYKVHEVRTFSFVTTIYHRNIAQLIHKGLWSDMYRANRLIHWAAITALVPIFCVKQSSGFSTNLCTVFDESPAYRLFKNAGSGRHACNVVPQQLWRENSVWPIRLNATQHVHWDTDHKCNTFTKIYVYGKKICKCLFPFINIIQSFKHWYLLLYRLNCKCNLHVFWHYNMGFYDLFNIHTVRK